MLSTAVNRLRGLIPRNLKRGIKAALGMPLTRLHPDWSVLRQIGPVAGPHVVLDVGAHHGWFFHCWLDWCPQAVVHAFEPTAESFVQAKALYGADPRVHLVQAGVGSETAELTLNILADSQVSNSFLLPRAVAWKSIEYATGAVSKRTVPVMTLDDYRVQQKLDEVYLLKIDVQGFELEVLKGAARTLPSVDYIFVETGIQRLYDGAPSYAEVGLLMEAHGFHLMHMRAWHRGNRVLVETDMLFRRNDLAPAIDRTRDRHYLELR